MAMALLRSSVPRLTTGDKCYNVSFRATSPPDPGRSPDTVAASGHGRGTRRHRGDDKDHTIAREAGADRRRAACPDRQRPAGRGRVAGPGTGPRRALRGVAP